MNQEGLSFGDGFKFGCGFYHRFGGGSHHYEYRGGYPVPSGRIGRIRWLERAYVQFLTRVRIECRM